MNKKKRGLLIIWISGFVLFTSLVFFVIGCNKGSLINNTLKIVFLILLILASLALIYGIFLLIKNKRRRLWTKVKVWIFSCLVGLYALGCSSFLFILYGPYNGFRDWLITTAMATMSHHYYCEWFYSDEFINKILSNNFIDDGGAETDPSLIDHKKTSHYSNNYEKEILERDKDDLYKIIKLKINGCDAFLAAIYDPSKIKVALSTQVGKSGQWPTSISSRVGSVLSVNGGGYMNAAGDTTGGVPMGITIAGSKIYSRGRIPARSYWGLIGFNKDDTLVLLKNVTAQSAIDMGVRDAVTMGPFLIVNGKPSKFSGNGGWGVAARTAIGQRKDGIVLFLVINSNYNRTKGATIVDLIEIMQNYGAVNAANLDGGTSSVMILPEKKSKEYSVCEGDKCCTSFNGKEKHCHINNPIDSAGRKQSRGMPSIFTIIP